MTVLFLAGSCSSSDNGNKQTGNYAITLTFTRVESAGYDPFTVDAVITGNGSPVGGITPSVTVDRGTTGTVTESVEGTYRFTVTPAQTGEHRVTVSYSGISTSGTALVLEDVHTDWGQPMSVEGYVNTEGYEDGVTITPDGEYLFVQTGPYRFSSLFVYNEPRTNGGCNNEDGNPFDDRLYPSRCEHPWINETCGTYTAPERPGFFSGRFSGTTQLHNAASWGVAVDGTPNYAMTTLFYGFKKQSDGSFREPFLMAFYDLDDGIISPYGLSFMKNSDGTHTIIFSLKDSFTTGESFDVYTLNKTLGRDINLGDYDPGSPPTRGSYFPSTLVDFGDNSGTQGNPFLHYDTNGNILSIWTDDEYDGAADPDYKKLSVYVLESGSFPSTGTWTKVLLPSNVNQGGKEAIQPTFTGNGLYFTEDTSVVYSAYSGTHSAADLGNNGNWTAPLVILQKDTTIPGLKVTEADIGKIIAIGEPTVATVSGKEVLYFVYGYIRGFDSITGIADIDMQAGFVEKK